MIFPGWDWFEEREREKAFCTPRGMAAPGVGRVGGALRGVRSFRKESVQLAIFPRESEESRKGTGTDCGFCCVFGVLMILIDSCVEVGGCAKAQKGHQGLYH